MTKGLLGREKTGSHGHPQFAGDGRRSRFFVPSKHGDFESLGPMDVDDSCRIRPGLVSNGDDTLDALVVAHDVSSAVTRHEML